MYLLHILFQLLILWLQNMNVVFTLDSLLQLKVDLVEQFLILWLQYLDVSKLLRLLLHLAIHEFDLFFQIVIFLDYKQLI